MTEPSYQDMKQILEKLTQVVSRHTHDLNRISQVFPSLSDDVQDQQSSGKKLVELEEQIQSLQAELRATQEIVHDPLHWLKLYHHSPEQLVDRALAVEPTPDSVRQSLQKSAAQPLQFVPQANGSYWLLSGWITAAGDRCDYLVPRTNIRLNIHNIDAVRLYFDCDSSATPTAKFTVIYPAIVLPQSYDRYWQLKTRGQLQFQAEE
jgi:hypothetical protein